MKVKKITSLILVLAFLSACAGKTPNPVMVAQYGDEQKSCDALKYEIQTMQNNMQSVLPKDKTGKNVVLGVTGVFFIVPWFFMDFSDAERIEYEAYRNRYNHLTSIAISKKCGVHAEQYPSIEELEKAYKDAQKKSGKSK